MTLPPTVSARLVRAVDDLQTVAPDLGWPEATALADALLDRLAHLLVDLADGGDLPPAPGPPPAPAGATGIGTSADHASCRAAAAALRRVSHDCDLGTGPGWAAGAGQVAGELAELLDQIAHTSRVRPLRLSDKGVVLRRLHDLLRRLP